MQMLNINPNAFLRAWIISAVGIWPVAGIACLVVWSPLALLLAMLERFSEFELIAQSLAFMAILFIPSMVIGYLLGDFQASLLRNHLQWNIESWQKQSVLGALVGGFFFILSGFAVGYFFDARSQWMLSMPLFVFVLSSFQWWALRRECRDAWLWVLANLVGGIIFSSLLFLNYPAELNSLHPLLVLGWWALAAGAQGLITGVVMLYLYERPYSDEERELAPVYIEVRNREDR